MVKPTQKELLQKELQQVNDALDEFFSMSYAQILCIEQNEIRTQLKKKQALLQKRETIERKLARLDT